MVFDKAELGANFYNPRSKQLIKQRIIIAEACKKSLTFRSEVLDRSRGDLIWWVNNFAFTADPRNLDLGKPVLTPFECFPVQEEYLRWRQDCRRDRVSGLLLKSRDSGASWLNVLHHVHSWLFEEGFKGGMASRKEKFVDELGNLDSLFEKVRFVIQNLPPWMVPGKADYQDSYLKIINHTNGSSIVGEAGEEIGRGGRMTFEDIDEAAFIPQAEKVYRALSQTTNTIFSTSTPNGLNNVYARQYNAGTHRTFMIHWSRDPRKDQQWYEKMCNTLDKLTIAREIDCSFQDSSDATIFRFEHLIGSIDKIPLDYLPRGARRSAGVDVATSGKNQTIYTVLIGGCVVEKQEEIDLTDPIDIAIEVHKRCLRDRIDDVAVDTIGVGEGVVSGLVHIPDTPYSVIPFRANKAPTRHYWVSHDCYSKERFINIRADLYFQLEEKIQKTYQHFKGLREFDLVDMLSLPREHSKLVTQLQQIEAIKRPDGKTKLMSKEEMREQNIASPDYADSLMLAYAACVLSRDQYGIHY